MLGVILYMLMTFYSTECEAGSEVETLGFCYGCRAYASAVSRWQVVFFFVFLFCFFFLFVFIFVLCISYQNRSFFFNPTVHVLMLRFYFVFPSHLICATSSLSSVCTRLCRTFDLHFNPTSSHAWPKTSPFLRVFILQE